MIRKTAINYKKIYTISVWIAILFITLGIILSVHNPRSIFSEGARTIRNVSFANTSFLKALLRAITYHTAFTLAMLILGMSFPGMVIMALCIIFKAFSIGVTVGLAATECPFGKALGICVGTVVSNVFIFPLYLLMFFIAVACSGGKPLADNDLGTATGEYLSYAAKILIVFAAMCAAELVQSALGTFFICRLR